MRSITTLIRERSGLAAVEFALLAPLIVSMLFGLFEGSRATLAYLKVISSAQTVADLVTQEQCVTAQNINDYVTAGQLVMTPLPTGSLGFLVTSVAWDPNTGAAAIDWQRAIGTTAPPPATEIALAQGYGTQGESVVIVQASYTYNSPINYVLPSPLTLGDTAFSRPRLVAKIPLQGACS